MGLFSFLRNIFGGKPAEIDETPSDMKYLVVGLGNIGSKYDDTRHNIGFDVVDNIAKDQKLKWELDTQAHICNFKYKGRSIYMIKPTTYMNLSGKAAQHWVTKLKIPVKNMLVVVDDLHLDLGVLKVKTKGSDGGHNGLKDMQQKFGSNYPRLRCGIGKDFHSGQQVNFVLGTWKKSERDDVNDMIWKASDAVLAFCTKDIKHVMEEFNKSR